MAPEVYKGEPHTTKIDIYGLGATIPECLRRLLKKSTNSQCGAAPCGVSAAVHSGVEGSFQGLFRGSLASGAAVSEAQR